jgi:hypothetical protein
MKAKFLIFTLFSAAIFLCPSISGYGKVTPYPAIPGLPASGIYTVEVNGHSIWVEKYVSNLDIHNLPDWFNAPYVRAPQEQHIASFSGEGELRVELTLPEPATEVVVRPLSLRIRPEVTGNKVSIDWRGPGQLVVEVAGLPPLYLFADPEEKEKPTPGDPNVKYFGPGVHEAGLIELKENETLYLAAGAVVYGGVRAQGANNIKVTGRGILDGDYRFSQMVRIENSSRVVFDGVTVRNGRGWTNTLINCRDVEYRYVKVLGFGPSSDGINPAGSQRVRIHHCFMRCTDDCVAIKAPDPKAPVQEILVENNIMIGFAYADGVTIGFETNAGFVRNVVVRNCDILLARGGSRVDGHSGFSIICDGPATVSNILFENIRVEKSEIKLFELHITDGTKYGTGPAGHIRDVIIRKVDWLHEGPVVIFGHDENHQVQNVLFENCTVAGKPFSEVSGQILQTNPFVNKIEIR